MEGIDETVEFKIHGGNLDEVRQLTMEEINKTLIRFFKVTSA